MNTFTRRSFLQTASCLPFLAIGAPGERSANLLSFSTLGCPDWDLPRILAFAAANKYNGVEIRGLQREIDLSKRAEFISATAIKETRKRAEDAGVKIINLGASTELHHTAREKREKNLDEAKRYIEIASKLKCPYVRVFPNNLPKDESRSATIELIIRGLQELSDFAKGSNVTVLLESHGDVVYIADLEKILNEVDSRRVALIWDVTNMWHITKEPPLEVFQRLGRFIRHVHLKDGTITTDGKLQYVLFGRGEIPLREAVQILHRNNYKGYYSFEWEKLWHPEIEEPEIALADFPHTIKKYFNS